MKEDPKYDRYLAELKNLATNKHLRDLKSLEKSPSGKVIWNGKEYLNLSSNDYLGLASDIDLYNSFLNEIKQEPNLTKYGLAGMSSRLLTGNTSPYEKLENLLSDLYNTESALVFNSGYHANIGIIPALSQKGDLIISDELIHASMIDGLRLSKAERKRFNHLDYDHLELILKEERANYDQVFIIAESLYSMNGDCTDLKKVVDLKNKYNAFLYLDEAHALGVRGIKGLGLAEEYNLISEIDLLVGTFGKAIASQGAFIVCKKSIKDFLVNKMRSLIFTTALPPICVSWTHFIMERISDYNEKRIHLNNISQKFKNALQSKPGVNLSNSHIIPLITGDNTSATQLAEKLQSQNFLAFPIRTPTVPENTARLRFSLTANLLWKDLLTLSTTL